MDNKLLQLQIKVKFFASMQRVCVCVLLSYIHMLVVFSKVVFDYLIVLHVFTSMFYYSLIGWGESSMGKSNT